MTAGTAVTPGVVTPVGVPIAAVAPVGVPAMIDAPPGATFPVAIPVKVMVGIVPIIAAD